MSDELKVLQSIDAKIGKAADAIASGRGGFGGKSSRPLFGGGSDSDDFIESAKKLAKSLSTLNEHAQSLNKAHVVDIRDKEEALKSFSKLIDNIEDNAKNSDRLSTSFQKNHVSISEVTNSLGIFSDHTGVMSQAMVAADGDIQTFIKSLKGIHDGLYDSIAGVVESNKKAVESEEKYHETRLQLAKDSIEQAKKTANIIHRK